MYMHVYMYVYMHMYVYVCMYIYYICLYTCKLDSIEQSRIRTGSVLYNIPDAIITINNSRYIENCALLDYYYTN